MIETASKELCERLYELSGWNNDSDFGFYWNNDQYEDGSTLWNLYSWSDTKHNPTGSYIPAYTLSFLLQKLPATIKMTEGDIVRLKLEKSDPMPERGILYSMWYESDIDSNCWPVLANTPTDAACKLAIALFEQKIIKKEE